MARDHPKAVDASQSGPRLGGVRRAVRGTVGRLMGAIGSRPWGPPIIRFVGHLSRRRILPQATADRAVERAVRPRENAVVVIRRAFGPGVCAELQLDLRYSGCRELLLSPLPGAPDISMTSLLIELAKDADLVVDVGANVGVYTYLVAAMLPGVRVVSIEPVPALNRLIAENVRRNGWQSRVRVRGEAVGSTRGEALLYVFAGSDTEHTVRADRIEGRDYQTVPVGVVTIDDLLASEAVAVSRVVLKIDVEGHERSALDGMERTLGASEGRPDIVVEFLGRAIHEDHVIERVLARGMDVYYIGPSDLTPIHRSADLGRCTRSDTGISS